VGEIKPQFFMHFGALALGFMFPILYGITYKEHRFDHVLTELKKISTSDAAILEVMSHYKAWYERIMHLRDADEHPMKINGKSLLNNYQIKNVGGIHYLERPSFYDGLLIHTFLKNSLMMLLHFCEDVVLVGLVVFPKKIPRHPFWTY
jgi:hypothetical protein